MSTLILTCNTGEGHNSCAKAIKEVYDANGIPCEIVDALIFVAPWFSRFVHRVFTAMYQYFPKVFRAGYGFTERHSTMTSAGSFPYWVLKHGVPRLYDHIIKHKITSIICVHPLLMMMVSALQVQFPGNYKTAYVSTDYTCCPGVRTSHPEFCFIPDDSLSETFHSETICANQIISSGIPVRQQFYHCTDAVSAKVHFGIPHDAAHILMMCGSMGCGPMEQILQFLSVHSDAHITVVCGTNEKLHKRLSVQYSNAPQVHIQGFIKDISLLMDSADVFVTKPGGLSSTEAAVKCIPMAFINAVGGCENYNLAFFRDRGGAVAGETPEETAQLCRELLYNPQRRGEMATALRQLKLPNASEMIFTTMQEIMP